METLSTIAMTIGYLAMAFGALMLVRKVLEDRQQQKSEDLRRAGDEAMKVKNPEEYARELEHRRNMDRLRNGLPVDREWAAGMEKAAAQMTEIQRELEGDRKF